MDTARVGFLMIAAAFPLYLLWRGELPAYLALMTAGAVLPGTASAPATSLSQSPVVNPLTPGTTTLTPGSTPLLPGAAGVPNFGPLY